MANAPVGGISSLKKSGLNQGLPDRLDSKESDGKTRKKKKMTGKKVQERKYEGQPLETNL